MVSLINIINKNKYYFNINLVKLRIRKRNYHFNINQINYEKPELRKIKNKIINLYYQKIKFNTSFKQHFFNHLIAINEEIGKKAILIKYLLNKRLNIDEISASFISEKDKILFSKYKLNIKKIKVIKTKLNPISVLLWFIQQYKDIRFKRTLFPYEKSNFSPKIKYTKMLRAWFKLSEKIYLNKLKKSLDHTIIYLTPHIINGKITLRQRKYLEFLKSNRRNYFFYLPKINFYFLARVAIKIYFSSFPINIKIPLLQIIKERMEIDDFIKYITFQFPSIKEFYTKEEFLPESIYLTDQLQKNNIKVINSAHGLGVYGTIVNYNLFYVFTKIQEEHYKEKANTKFELFHSIKPINRETTVDKEFALLFIHQNVLSTPSRRSTVSIDIYKEVLNYVEKIALDLNIHVFAKYHPGSTERDKILSNKINIINRIEDLPEEYRYLAITLHSSYVLELLERMPFLIINPENRMNLKDFFPDTNSIYTYTYKDFKKKIERFLENPSVYYDYWNNLISSIYDL